jgi:hypothetical protein
MSYGNDQGGQSQRRVEEAGRQSEAGKIKTCEVSSY